jgi:hypothetical protein
MADNPDAPAIFDNTKTPPIVDNTKTPLTVDNSKAPAGGDALNNSENLNRYVDWHLNDVKKSILEEVKKKAAATGGMISASNASGAVGLFSSTEPIPKGPENSPIVQALLNIVNIPGIIWISAILATVFGILASTTKEPSLSASMSDIAKVFAGAIVGASGATATAAIRRS